MVSRQEPTIFKEYSLRNVGVLGIFPRKRTKASVDHVFRGLQEGVTFNGYVAKLVVSASHSILDF